MWVGLSDGNIATEGFHCGESPNSYMINQIDCHINGQERDDFLPEGAEQQLHWNQNENLVGCGLLLAPNPNDQLAVFFTFNGQLMGQFSFL
jgi:hypothetical protein